MKANNSDPSLPIRPELAQRQEPEENEHVHKVRARITLMRTFGALLALGLLILSIVLAMPGIRPSYAHVNNPLDPCALTVTPVPTCTPTAPANPTPTDTPTPIPPTPTAVPTNPPPPPPTKTPKPTATPTATATAMPTATAIPTTTSQTPVATATSAPAIVGGNNGNTSSGGQSGGGDFLRLVMIIGGVILLLLLSLGIGWLVFRRMLTPQIASANLPPSGARPWSRTRVPSPNSTGSAAVPNLDMAQFNMNAAKAFNTTTDSRPLPTVNNFEQPNAGYMQHNSGYLPIPNSFEAAGNGYMQQQNGFEPQMQGFNQAPNGFPSPIPNSFAPQGMGMQGYDPQQTSGFRALSNGFASFSDSFVPPTPQIFPQNNAGMIPPGSGAFPLPDNHAGGFAPASNAFNAMYGLPNDPFMSSQPGAPAWVDSLNGGNGFAGSQQSPVSDFITGEPDLNDPYLAELIRQYSQKGPAVQPQQQPQQRPGNPNSNWLQ